MIKSLAALRSAIQVGVRHKSKSRKLQTAAKRVRLNNAMGCVISPSEFNSFLIFQVPIRDENTGWISANKRRVRTLY